MFLNILGALFYNHGRYGCTIIAVNFVNIVVALKYLFVYTVGMRIARIMLWVNLAIVGVSIFD